MQLLFVIFFVVIGLAISSAKLIKLDHDNMVVIRGGIAPGLASKVVDDLLNKRSKEIYVYIDSYGGSVDSGLQIIQVMESLQNSGITVHTIANDVASMGFVIHQAGKQRYVRPWSILMQHQMTSGNRDQYYNLKSYNGYVDKLYHKLMSKQAAVSNRTLEEFDSLTRHDLWVHGSDAVDLHFADEIVDVICDFKPTLFEVTERVLWFEVIFTFSTCPLAAGPIKWRFDESSMNSSSCDGNCKNEIISAYNFNHNVAKLYKLAN